jgi:predicted nucleic acid-binding protein
MMFIIGFDRFNLRAAGFPSPDVMLAPTARRQDTPRPVRNNRHRRPVPVLVMLVAGLTGLLVG